MRSLTKPRTESLREFSRRLGEHYGVSASTIRDRWRKGHRGKALLVDHRQWVLDSRRQWCGKSFRGWTDYLQMYGVKEATFNGVRSYYYNRHINETDIDILRRLFAYHKANHPELVLPSVLEDSERGVG